MFRNRHQCIGITATGSQCMNYALKDSTRCGIHQKGIITNGPNATAIIELDYKHQQEIRKIHTKYEQQPDIEKMETELLMVIDRQHEEKRQLIDRQREEIQRTGIDPDREAKDRKEAKRLERNRIARERAAQQREREMRERLDDTRNPNEQYALQRAAAEQAALQAAQRQGELGRIAADSQGVHNHAVVKMVSKTINKILKISVPSEYRWNMTTCSKTPGDIILKCKLSPKGAWQMSSQYCQNANIYNLGEGIYGKVLDCIWQYILTSKDSDDLMKILKREMEDNIGMCAQGNLTRLCNILGGYLEGIEVKEPIAQVLGRKFPSLFEIENVEQRVQAAYKILVDEGVPQSDWLTWLTPLINDDDDEKWYRIEIENNTSTGRVKLVEIPYEINYEG